MLELEPTKKAGNEALKNAIIERVYFLKSQGKNTEQILADISSESTVKMVTNQSKFKVV